MIKLLGYSLPELVGMEIFEIGLFGDAAASQDMFQTLKASGQIRYEDLPLQTREGALREIEVVANSYDENGHSVIQFNIRDITQRKQVQKALSDSDNRFRLALQNSQISVFEQDIDLRYTWIYNPKLGYDVNSVLGKTDADLMDGGALPQLIALKTGVLATGRSANQDVTVSAPGQVPYHFHLSVEPRLGSDGEIEGIISTAVDITGQKDAEVELREREARQAFLLKLSDALRTETSADAMTDRALRMLSRHMRIDRCSVVIYRLAEDTAEFPQQVHDDSLPPLPAKVRLSDFPKALQVVLERTLVIEETAKVDGLSVGERSSFAGLGMGALIAATLRHGQNNPLWAIVAVSTAPRVWTVGEVSLVEDLLNELGRP